MGQLITIGQAKQRLPAVRVPGTAISLYAREQQRRWREQHGLGQFDPVSAGVIGTSLLQKLFSFFGHGHEDDAVDQAEETILFEFIVPIVQAAGATPGRTWQSVTAAIATINPATSLLSPGQASELIAQGDQIIADACAQFQQARYPCPPAPPGAASSGAGRDIKPMWDALRAKLVQIAAQSPVASVLAPLTSAAAGVGGVPWLWLLVGAGAVYLIAKRT
ncbi:MAG: hypothetical protein L0212_04135 [Acidobacteria bacterium]|nr:hypothetical protein [Acidobacteriota bacterium]